MTWPLGLDVATRKAVVILASQKTLPIAVTVISLIDDGSFEAGTVAIPCFCCHLMQLAIDSASVGAWAKRTEPAAPLGLGRAPAAGVELDAAP